MQIKLYSIALCFTTLLFTQSSLAVEPIKYSGYCAWSLLEKKLQRNKCTVNWISPEKHKFCFIDEEAMQDFLKNTWGNTHTADENYANIINRSDRAQEKKASKKANKKRRR